MPLTREQFNACHDTLKPHVDTTPEERRALVNRALYGSKVMEKIDWTGNAQTFASNLVDTLQRFDDVTSLVLLLEMLRTEAGEPTASAISALIRDLAPPPTPPPPAARPGGAAASPHDGYVFISYSRQDFAFVDRLRQDLTKHGIAYWIDREGLAPGTRNWERRIRAAIRDCSAVVWVASPAAYASDYVDGEIAIAETSAKPIYPVWADGDKWIDCVPMEKRRAQYIDMRGPAYAHGLGVLIAVLRGSGEVPPIPPEPTRSLPPGQPL